MVRLATTVTIEKRRFITLRSRYSPTISPFRQRRLNCLASHRFRRPRHFLLKRRWRLLYRVYYACRHCCCLHTRRSKTVVPKSTAEAYEKSKDILARRTWRRSFVVLNDGSFARVLLWPSELPGKL